MATCPVLRPWESAALNGPPTNAAPGTGLQSLVYSRTVSVHRLRTVADEPVNIGYAGYSGAEQIINPAGDVEGEDVLFTGLPAAIQLQIAGRSKGPLPADIAYKPTWKIIISANAIAEYAIRDRDIITDEEGYRYGVGGAYWTGLSYELSCIRLEA